MGKKKALLLGVLLLFFVGIFYIWVSNVQKKTKVTINGHTFFVETASTSEEREKGLSNHSPLSGDSGMLFIFQTPGTYSFWMKDMLFPLDIIYISNNKIVTIFKSIPQPAPHTADSALPLYTPASAIDSVLEIHAGLSDTYGFKVGDTVLVNNY